MFKLIVLSRVRYCATILSMANKTNIEKLQKNFKKEMGAVLNKRRSENVNGLLNELDI